LPVVRNQYESKSAEAIHQMALASMGVAICPAGVVEDDLQQKRLIRLLPDFDLPVQNIQLLYSNTRSLPAKTRIFIDFLIEHLSL
jgi:DNA-binding transcriptional LysR family regulator